jgi:hypothetical protein
MMTPNTRLRITIFMVGHIPRFAAITLTMPLPFHRLWTVMAGLQKRLNN